MLRDAVLARAAIFLAAFAGAASCDGATEPDPYAALYGEYQLYLYNGYGLPAQAPPVAGSSWEQVSRGRLTLRTNRSYLLTEGSVTLGRGKQLFPRRVLSPALRLESVRRIGSGMAELRYEIRRGGENIAM